MPATPILQLGHCDYIRRLDFSPDGTRLASADEAGVLKLWEVATGRLLCDLVEDGCTPEDSDDLFRFSVDGSVLLLRAPTFGVVLYDALTGRRLAECGRADIRSLAVTEAGILAPLTGPNGTDVIDVVRDRVVSHLPWPDRGHRPFGHAAISPDGQVVCAASTANRMVVWDRATGEVIDSFPVPVNDPSVEPVLSYDNSRVAFDSLLDPVLVVKLQTREFSAPFAGPGLAERFWLDATGERMAACLGTYVMVWHTDTGSVLHDTREGTHPAIAEKEELLEGEQLGDVGRRYAEEASVCFPAEGGVLFAWSEGNELYVEELGTQRQLWHTPPAPASPYGYQICVSPAGDALVRSNAQLIDEDHSLVQRATFWQLPRLTPSSLAREDAQGFLRFVPLPDGQAVLCVGEERISRLKWSDGELISEAPASLDGIADAVLDPVSEGRLIIGEGDSLRALDLDTGHTGGAFKPPPAARFLSFLSRLVTQAGGGAERRALDEFLGPLQHLVAACPGHGLLVSAHRDLGLCSWDASTGRCIRRRSLAGRACTALALSPDGRFLVAGMQENIEVYGLPELEHLSSLSGHTNTVEALTWSRDPSLFASGGADSTMRLWRMPDGELLRTLKGHTGPVYEVRFIPGGNLIVSASSDATMRIWDRTTGSLVRTVFDPAPGEYVSFAPSGEMDSTPGAERHLAYTVTDADSCRSLSVGEYTELEGTPEV